MRARTSSDLALRREQVRGRGAHRCVRECFGFSGTSAASATSSARAARTARSSTSARSSRRTPTTSTCSATAGSQTILARHRLRRRRALRFGERQGRGNSHLQPRAARLDLGEAHRRARRRRVAVPEGAHRLSARRRKAGPATFRSRASIERSSRPRFPREEHVGRSGRASRVRGRARNLRRMNLASA